MTEPSNRVLIIGLDGATFDLIHPWVEAGYLPNIAKLISDGCSGRLRSTIQPTTAPAWTSFLTGVNQGKHGLYDFVRRRSGSYDLEVTNASHVSSSTIFDIASLQGRRVIAINVPYTFPPRPVNGLMIAGPFAPGFIPQLVYPPDYFATLQSIMPDYFILPDYDPRQAKPLEAYAQNLVREIEIRERLSLHLLQREAWDVFMVVFMATDEAQHAFWHFQELPEDDPLARHRNVIRDVYQRADQAIGAILGQIAADSKGSETTVIIVSDHGAGPLRWMINLNRWLAEAGYLQFHKTSDNRVGRMKSVAVKKMAYAYRRYVPARWRASMRARLGARRFERAKAEVESTLYASAIDWAHTKAYALGAGGNLFINLQGREPAGIVQPGDEYDRLCQEIIGSLEKMVDPNSGQAIIERVYRREELYQGPFLEQAPDLVIQWKDYACWGRGRYDSLAPAFESQSRLEYSDLPLTGSHRPEGILIAKGSSIRRGGKIEGPRLIDMAPTILGILSIRPPMEMDGQPLKNLFTSEEASRILELMPDEGIQPSSQAFEYTDEDAQKISERLRSLGYL